jgi:hypothetical protein
MKLSTLLLLCSTSLPGMAGTAFAQGGGFDAGELFLYSPVQSTAYTGDGILRVDPLTGASSVLVPTAGSYPAQGLAMAFDPYRQRLVFSATIGASQNQVWFADGAGSLQNVTGATYPAGIYLDNFAPTGDGRIYCHLDGGSAAPLYWYDAANQLHVLYDSDGVTPMQVNASLNYNGMIHDAATNSLFVASSQPGAGFPIWATNVFKLPLSADGSRVIGPVVHSVFEVSPNPPQFTSGEYPRGWSHGPDGQLILIVNCVDALVMQRMLSVDPVTAAISVWGSTGDSLPPDQWSHTTGGAYSSAIDRVVVVDYTHSQLHAYAQGSSGGPGTVIATQPALSGFSITGLQMISVPPDECTGGWIAYGLGLKGAGNFVPELTGSGCPEPGAPIVLRLSNALGGSSAALFVGVSKAALPFKGGTFHLGPVLLTVNLAVGGAPGAAGAGSLSLPSALPPLPVLSGTSLYLQAGFSDAAAVQKVSLTQGLQLEIG